MQVRRSFTYIQKRLYVRLYVFQLVTILRVHKDVVFKPDAAYTKSLLNARWLHQWMSKGVGVKISV